MVIINSKECLSNWIEIDRKFLQELGLQLFYLICNFQWTAWTSHRKHTIAFAPREVRRRYPHVSASSLLIELRIAQLWCARISLHCSSTVHLQASVIVQFLLTIWARWVTGSLRLFTNIFEVPPWEEVLDKVVDGDFGDGFEHSFILKQVSQLI